MSEQTLEQRVAALEERLARLEASVYPTVAIYDGPPLIATADLGDVITDALDSSVTTITNALDTSCERP